MNFTITPNFKPLPKQLNYSDTAYFIGSCFATNLFAKLQGSTIGTACNTHGIVFDPLSIAKSLIETIQCKVYTKADLHFYNELWHSWQHHGSFNNVNYETVLENINTNIKANHSFLKGANWLIITLGSAYNYNLKLPNGTTTPVANCHKYPIQYFDKKLLETEAIKAALDPCYHMLKQFNPNIKIIFTVSPVRYLKYGLVENNRSKARLIEIAHHFCNKFTDVFYFPAYEIVVDVLRDYRFFTEDYAHPTPQAIQYVYLQFMELACTHHTKNMLNDVASLQAMQAHKPLHKGTLALAKFNLAIIKKQQNFNKQWL